MSQVMSLFPAIDQQLQGISNIAFCRMLARYDPGRVSDYNRVWGDVKVHKGKGSDEDIISDCNVPNNADITPDPYIISNYRITLPFTSKLHPDSAAMVHGTILPDNRSIVHCYVSTMNQDESLADLGMPTDLNPCFQGIASKQPSGQKRMTFALIQAEKENPSEINFSDSRGKQIPEPSFSVVSV